MPDIAPRNALAGGFRLGDFEVIPQRNVVVGGERTIHLEPKIMDVCCFMASRSGEVISRDELIDEVWKLKFGSDESLTRAIYVLRKTFNHPDSASNAIETIPKRGYRLLLPVTCPDAALSADAALPGDEQESWAEHGPPGSTAPPQSELRHVVVLSCRLDRLTNPASQIDPESRHGIAVAYRRAVMRELDKFAGHLASEFGSELVICFGYPQAQEDAAQRAIQAGLAIMNAVAAITIEIPKLSRLHPSASIGIHCGVVMVTPNGNSGVELFGETLRIAALVRDKSPPATLWITDVVHELVGNIFTAEALGISIASEDEDEFRLLSVPKAAITDHSRWSRRELLPFVGRSADVALAIERLKTVRDGTGGSYILVSGEAGVGKSRLVAEVKERSADLEILWLETAGSSLHSNAPFYTIIQLIEGVVGWKDVVDQVSRQNLLEQALLRAGLDTQEALPLIADLLRLPIPDGYRELAGTPETKRKRLIATMAEWIFNVASEMPVALHIEDMHWVDPSSLEFIQLLAEQCSGFPLVLIVTARPEFEAPWARRGHHVDLVLTNLSVSDTRSLVLAVLPEDGVHGDVLDAVVERSGGVPLFAEELAHLVVDRGRSIGAREIPATLFDSLSARLDKLDAAKEIAQLGAVLGREFPYTLLAAISPMDESKLRASLIQLANAGLLQERGLAPNARYSFKHALIQDAAYEALLPSRRRELHALVAQTISDKFTSVAEAQPQVVANHWTEAGVFEKAIPLWVEAGKAAVSRHAFEEAADDLRSGHRLLANLPETAERDAQEIEISFALRRVLYTLSGYRGQEVRSLMARNAVIAENMDDIRLLIQLTFSSFVERFMASNWLAAAADAQELIVLSSKTDATTNAETRRLCARLANYSQFLSHFYQGEIAKAEQYFKIWESLPEVGGELEKNRIAPCFSHAATCAALAGRLDLAAERQAIAVAHSLESGDLWDQVFVTQFGALRHIQLADAGLAMPACEDALAKAKSSGFQQIEALALPCAGLAKARLGDPEPGLAMIETGIAKLVALDSRVSMGAFIGFRAEAEAACGKIDEARASFEEALQCNPEEQIYSPQNLIGRARLNLQTGRDAQAKQDLRTALNMARTKGAKTIELRARVGLADLLESQGRVGQALELLTQFVDDFGEQPLSIDLQQAKALIGKLTSH